jgi:hypothetical protein
MKNTGNNEGIIYLSFENKKSRLKSIKKNSDPQIISLIGNKSPIKRYVKAKIDIKVPMIKIDSSSYEDNSIKIPSMESSPIKLSSKVPIKSFTPTGFDIKSFDRRSLSNDTENFLPKVNKPGVVKKSIDNKFYDYSELIGFIIKNQIESLPIYQKIDIQRKGKIEYLDFLMFISRNYPHLDPAESFARVFKMNFIISKETSITKRSFLALCTGIKYKIQCGRDFKSIFIDIPMEVLVGTIKSYLSLFSQFTSTRHIQISQIFLFKNFSEEKYKKSLKIVFSEPVDLPRFITCIPFFYWVKSQ